MKITELNDTTRPQSNLSQEPSQNQIGRLVMVPIPVLPIPLKSVELSAFNILNQISRMSHTEDEHGVFSLVNRCVEKKRGKSHSPMPVNKDSKKPPTFQKSISLFIDGNFFCLIVLFVPSR